MNEPSFFELARQALSSTRRGYDLLAPKFEYTPYATPTEWIEQAVEFVSKRYPSVSEEPRGADLACGTGRGARVLRGCCCHQVDGYDFSSGMLEKASQLSGGTSGLRWIQGDLAQLELPREFYDRMVTFGAWGHILPQFRMQLLSQIPRALKPGGVFFTLTADEARPWEKRFWISYFFDLAIRLRNLVWFSEFHMYYRLNSTQQLLKIWEEVSHNRDCPEFEVAVHHLEDQPTALKLLILRRIPND